MPSVDRMRRRLLQTEHLPYVRLGWYRAPEAAVRAADALVSTGYRPSGGGKPIPVVVPFPWDRVGEVGSTLELIEPLLEAHAATGDVAYLEPAVRLALDGDHGANAVESSGVVGERAYRLAGLIASSAAVVSEDDLLALLAAAEQAAEVLEVDTGEDGLMAAVGLLALGTRLEGALSRARRRAALARRCLNRHLGGLEGEGMGPGMSPRDLARTAEVVAALDAAGMLEVDEVRMRIEDGLAWFLLPDGALAGLGNTPDETLSGEWGIWSAGAGARGERHVSPALRSAVSAGAWGRSPGECTVFPAAGYAMVRRNGESHLALSGRPGPAVTWFDKGRRLLVGPGARVARGAAESNDGDSDPVGVAPEEAAAYLGSVAAHNTVEIVGIDALSSDVELALSEGEPHAITVSAIRGNVRHRRRLGMEPGRWMVVVDDLEAKGSHVYRQWFHAPGDLDVVVRDWGLLLAHQGEPVVWVVSGNGSELLTPVRADSIDPVAGWWSPRGRSLVPRWSFGWESEGPTATMGVLFSLAGRPELDETRGSWHIEGRPVPMEAVP